MAKRIPSGMKLASVLIWFEAVIAILASVLAIGMGTAVATYFGLTGLISVFTAAGLIGLALGVVWAVLGYLLWKMNTYAWWIAFILTLFSLIGTIFGIFAGFFGVVITGFGTLSVMAIIGLVLNLVKFAALTDKDSMKSVKVKLGSWKGMNIF